MKVYVISWFDAEPYSDYSGVHSIYSSKEDAEQFLKEAGTGPHNSYNDSDDYKYFLYSEIEEYKVL